MVGKACCSPDLMIYPDLIREPVLTLASKYSHRFYLACTLVVGLFSFNAVHATDAGSSGPPPEAVTPSLAASSQPESAAIQIKLHALEDLRGQVTRTADVKETSLAPHATPQSGDIVDEMKKQAQAAYLARRLKKHESTVRKYVDLAWAEASRRPWLAPELIIAIIHKESSFRPQVQSRYGAQGLMQVVRRWHREKLHPSESLFDPEVNIRVGADVLEEYLEAAGGNLDVALKKYSGNARNYVSSIKKETHTLARVAERVALRSHLARREAPEG